MSSWPAEYCPLGITIDHCLVSPDIEVKQRLVGPDVGSDHLPVIVDLLLETPADD